MWIDQRGSEVLTRNECLRLVALRAGGVGRVGHVVSDQVVVEPVNYRVFQHDVVVQVGSGSILEAARRGEIVAFEVDELSPTERSAWSVLVQGLATVIDPEQMHGARPVGTVPLVPEPGSAVVRIRTGMLSGRRFSLRPTGLPTENAAAPPPGLAAEISSLRLRPPTRLGRDASIREVAGSMADHGVSCVLVGEHPWWFVTDHDLAGAVACGLDPSAPAAGLATKSPVWVTPSSTLADAAALMAKHNVRHLLVITAEGEAVGVLPLIDLIRSLLAEGAAG